MARTDPRTQKIGIIKKVYDIKGGMVSNFPAEEIPDNKANFIKNMVSDRRNVLRKVWGTQELITGDTAEAYNKFITNPVYTFYNYATPEGFSSLIIQGVDSGDSKMSLYTLPMQGSYPAALSAAPTRILGSGDELVSKRRLTYATYKGRLYIWNGVDALRYWDGNDWRIYHDDNAERFKYIHSYGQRLWAASSGANPSRLIYTDLKCCNFHHYFDLDANRIDFASAKDYSPIMWICEFKDSLLIFKVNSIYRLWGNPDDSISFDCISEGVGTISGWSVQVWKELVYFAWTDGVYVLGDASIVASLEDRKLQVQSNIIRISSEIDDYWEDNFTLPNPYKTNEKVWSGATDFGNFTLDQCQANTASVTENPDVINASLHGTATKAESEETTGGATWVDLRSDLGSDQYNAQSVMISETDEPMPHSVKLYLENNGTLTTTQKLKVQMTYSSGDSPYEPDYDYVFAEASYDLDGVTSAGWYTITFDYWDYPKSFYEWATGRIFIVVKAVGDTDSLYAKWHYITGNLYANGQMVNSDDATPGTQEDKDYNFQLYTDKFEYRSYVTTDSYEATDTDRQEWGIVTLKIDETGGRRMVLDELEYNLSADNSTWDGWVETENGAYLGEECVTSKYIKFKGSFKRSTGASAALMDSFTLISVRITYSTQDFVETLVDSVIYKDNYIISVSDIQVLGIGNCLDFDGDDDVWIENSDTLDMGTSDFAVEFWIKGAVADQAASWFPIIGDWAGYYYVTGDHGWMVRATATGLPLTSKLSYAIDDPTNYVTMTNSPNLLDGNPHYVRMNFDRNNECTAWVDEVEITGTHDISATDGVDLSNNLPFLLGAGAVRLNIGSAWEINIWYDGKLKQLKLYKGRLLTTADGTYNYANPTLCYDTTNLVGWWKCSAGKGDTIVDYSDNNNHGLRGNRIAGRKPKWAVW